MIAAHAFLRSSLEGRSSSLDLIKWLAMMTMVIDHLRLVWPEMSNLFIPGRLSFPLFCVAIAANVARSKPGDCAEITSSQLFAVGNAPHFNSRYVFNQLSYSQIVK